MEAKETKKWTPPRRGAYTRAPAVPYPSFVGTWATVVDVESPAATVADAKLPAARVEEGSVPYPPLLPELPASLRPETALGHLFHHPGETVALLRTLVREQEDGTGAALWAAATPPQVAAQFLIALGQQVSGRILALLDPAKRDAVLEAIAATPGLPHRRTEEIIELACRRLRAGEYTHTGGELFARTLSESAPEDAEARQPTDHRARDLQHLADVSPAQVAQLLSQQHPQITAAVLSQLPSEASGAILDRLPRELRGDVCRRIAHLQPIDPQALEDLGRIAEQASRWARTHEVGGIEVAADILNRSGAATASAILGALEEEDPGLATALRRLSLGQALERVRDFVLAMKSAADLHRVLAVLREELERLGVRLTALQIHAMEHHEDGLRIIGESGRDDDPLRTEDIVDAALCRPYVAHWRDGFIWDRRLTPGDLALWTNSAQADETRLSTPPWGVDIPFGQGTLSLIGPQSFSASGIDLMEFSEVADLAFARFSDFRTASEAQQKLIAELEETNAQLREAKEAAELANHAKSQFLANISHEIRTPMNAILGYAQILEHHSQLAPDQRTAVRTIQQSGNHLLKLINEVLDLSKIEAGRMELHTGGFDLAHLLESMSTMFELRCREKQLRWRLQGPDAATLPVRGDESKLMQVFINLLGNAVKFTDAGEVALLVEAHADDRYRFVISDTGQGISEAEQQRIFQVFEQGEAGLRKGGTGLGLAISQRILALMDSQLELESMPGQGTRFSFTVRLPAAARDTVPTEDDVRWERVACLAPGVQVRALVADDIDANRHILAQLLEAVGVEVDTAIDGEDALDAIQRRRPDIVLMDIRMPRMDGMEAVRRLRQREDADGLKVVAVSASTLEHERQECLTAGFDAFVGKPVQTAELYRCLAQLLDVEFSFSSQGGDDMPDEAPDPAQVHLPAALRTSLLAAARLAQVTALEQHLDTMAEAGPDAARLARHLRQLSQDFQFDEVVALLEGVNVEA